MNRFAQPWAWVAIGAVCVISVAIVGLASFSAAMLWFEALFVVAVGSVMVSGMSRPARTASVVVALTTVGSVAVAVLAYRNSTDGQGGAFWGLLVLYGLLVIGAIRLVDGGLRTWRKRAVTHE